MLQRTTMEGQLKRLPPLGSIQAFVQVARLGSFKAAADSLALSSPALTRRVQSLEHILGGPLLLRQSNTVQPNARGERLLMELEPHLEGLAAAFDSVSSKENATRIRIAVPSLFAAQRLMPALPGLRERRPNLLIDLDTGANRISRLDDGIDAVIAVADTIDSDRYYARMIERGRVVAIASRKQLGPLSSVHEPADVRNARILIHREMPKAFDEWRDAIGMPDLEAAGTSYYDAGQLILDAAAEGLGIAFMLEQHLAYSCDPRLVRVFTHPVPSRYSYWFVCSPAALKRAAVKQFHDWLFEHFSGEQLGL